MSTAMTEQTGLGLQYLTVELPEDIRRVKEYGDFAMAQQMIGRRLLKNLPEALRQRLLLEQEILRQLPAQYPHGWTEAVRLMEETFSDFGEMELHQLVADGAVEWIYIQGKIRLKDNFIANLIKTREELPSRLRDRMLLDRKLENFRLLNQVMQEMKKQERIGCYFRIRSTVTVHEEAQRPGEKIQVQIPIPVEYSQVGHFRLLNQMPDGWAVAPGQYPQRTVCLETISRPGQAFQVEYEFETEMHYWNPELAEEMSGKSVGISEKGMDFAGYLGEELPHICFSPYLKNLTEEVIGGEKDSLKKARKIYDFITINVMYSFVRSYFTISRQVEFAATSLKGDCGIQALLFITMCRIAGIPARWQSGLYATPLEIGCHDWAQFYLEPFGWLYADCSFGGAAYRAGDMERWEFYFGNLDPYRLPAASSYQKDFYFPKKYLRSDPYDNQVGEVEYDSAGLTAHKDFDTLHDMVEIKLLK